MIEMPEIFQKVKLQIAVVLRRVLKDNFSFLKDSLSLSRIIYESHALWLWPADSLLSFFVTLIKSKGIGDRRSRQKATVKKTQGMHVTSYRISRLLLMDSRAERHEICAF